MTCAARLWRAARCTPRCSRRSTGPCWAASCPTDTQGCSEPVLHERRMLFRRDGELLPVGPVLRHPLTLGERLIGGASHVVRTQGDEHPVGIPWRQAEEGEGRPRLAR